MSSIALKREVGCRGASFLERAGLRRQSLATDNARMSVLHGAAVVSIVFCLWPHGAANAGGSSIGW
jgi:hypothetical protein